MKISRNTTYTTLTLTVLFLLLTTAAFTGCSKVDNGVATNESSSNDENGNIESAEVTPAEQNLIQTVEKAIQDPSKPEFVNIPANVKVLSLNIEGNEITVNYSKEILANGTGGELEDVLHYLSTKIDNEIFSNAGIQEYENLKKARSEIILIEGKPLQDYR